MSQAGWLLGWFAGCGLLNRVGFGARLSPLLAAAALPDTLHGGGPGGGGVPLTAQVALDCGGLDTLHQVAQLADMAGGDLSAFAELQGVDVPAMRQAAVALLQPPPRGR